MRRAGSSVRWATRPRRGATSVVSAPARAYPLRRRGTRTPTATISACARSASSAATYGASCSACVRSRFATRSRNAADSVSMQPAAVCGCTGSTLGSREVLALHEIDVALQCDQRVALGRLPPISTSCPDSQQRHGGSTRSRWSARSPARECRGRACRDAGATRGRCSNASRRTRRARSGSRPCAGVDDRRVARRLAARLFGHLETRCGGSPSAFRFASSASPDGVHQRGRMQAQKSHSSWLSNAWKLPRCSDSASRLRAGRRAAPPA